MARAWIIDSRGIAKKVKNATAPSGHQIKDCGANRECPNCHYRIDNTDVAHEWPGLPAGVKFEPSDIELLDHLASKCGVGNSKPHMFIDEFIPTLTCDEGICCSHPEDLPGAKKDGSSVHFFYCTTNAYTSGQRKRRRIQGQESMIKERVRWHKTGKTKAIIENGVQKGCKKIMVLYSTSKKGTKPDKCNWVMHQYHLGTDEDEREGEYVVSKIFYQAQKESDKVEASPKVKEPDIGAVGVIPRTPKTSTPDLPKRDKTLSPDDVPDAYAIQSLVQGVVCHKESPHPPSNSQLKDEKEYSTGLAGDLEAVDFCGLDSLLCDEIIDSYATFDDLRPDNAPSTQVTHCRTEVNQNDGNAACGIADLENLELDTPPDFQLADLQFASQDSVFDWLDKL